MINVLALKCSIMNSSLKKKKYITKLEVLESLLVTVHSNLKHISCLQTSCFLHMHADTFTDFPLNS